MVNGIREQQTATRELFQCAGQVRSEGTPEVGLGAVERFRVGVEFGAEAGDGPGAVGASHDFAAPGVIETDGLVVEIGDDATGSGLDAGEGEGGRTSGLGGRGLGLGAVHGDDPAGAGLDQESGEAGAAVLVPEIIGAEFAASVFHAFGESGEVGTCRAAVEEELQGEFGGEDVGFETDAAGAFEDGHGAACGDVVGAQGAAVGGERASTRVFREEVWGNLEVAVAEDGVPEAATGEEVQVLMLFDAIVGEGADDPAGALGEVREEHIRGVGVGDQLEVGLVSVVHELVEIEGSEVVGEFVVEERTRVFAAGDGQFGAEGVMQFVLVEGVLGEPIQEGAGFGGSMGWGSVGADVPAEHVTDHASQAGAGQGVVADHGQAAG